MAVEIYKSIPVAAILKANAARKQIAPNGYFNKLLLGKDKDGNYKEIPPNILGVRPWFTGTGFAIEAKDKALGKTIEKEFYNQNARKNQTLVYCVRKKHIGSINVMHLFDHHIYKNGKSTMQLINLKNNKEIINVNDLNEASDIHLKVAGKISIIPFFDRNGKLFEVVDASSTNIWANDESAVGLLACGDINVLGTFNRTEILAFNWTLGESRGLILLDNMADFAGTAAKNV